MLSLSGAACLSCTRIKSKCSLNIDGRGGKRRDPVNVWNLYAQIAKARRGLPSDHRYLVKDAKSIPTWFSAQLERAPGQGKPDVGNQPLRFPDPPTRGAGFTRRVDRGVHMLSFKYWKAVRRGNGECPRKRNAAAPTAVSTCKQTNMTGNSWSSHR